MTQPTTWVLGALFSASAVAIISGSLRWLRSRDSSRTPEPVHESQHKKVALAAGVFVTGTPIVAGSHHTVAFSSAAGTELPSQPIQTSVSVPQAPGGAEVSPEPNLVCSSARMTEVHYDSNSDIFEQDAGLPAAIAIFENDPSPPCQGLPAEGLIAEIKYYDRGSNQELAYVPSGCWLDEPYARTCIAPSQAARLILGIPAEDGIVVVTNCRFESEHYSEDAISREWLRGKSFEIEVTLSAGEYTEFVYVFRFEIELEPDVSIR
jgi:hypothetical protein